MNQLRAKRCKVDDKDFKDKVLTVSDALVLMKVAVTLDEIRTILKEKMTPDLVDELMATDKEIVRAYLKNKVSGPMPDRRAPTDNGLRARTLSDDIDASLKKADDDYQEKRGEPA